MKYAFNNPFAASFTIELVGFKFSSSITTKQFTIKEESTTVCKEKQKAVMFYETPYDTQLFFKLKPRTRDLFLYILLNLGYEEEVITLYYKKVSKMTGMSNNSFYIALKELKKTSVICSREKDTYWINPYFLFKGNRMKFYTENYEVLTPLLFVKDMGTKKTTDII